MQRLWLLSTLRDDRAEAGAFRQPANNAYLLALTARHAMPCHAEQGFPAARATRALYHSGGGSLEAAIGWLEEHQVGGPIRVGRQGSTGGAAFATPE